MSEDTSRARECLDNESPLAGRRQSARVLSVDPLDTDDELAKPQEPESLRLARSQLGRKPQVAGALVIFIGALLFLFTAPAEPGAVVDLHKLAVLFLVIGAFLFAFGTLARWYYLT
jgi:hypothetical protein